MEKLNTNYLVRHYYQLIISPQGIVTGYERPCKCSEKDGTVVTSSDGKKYQVRNKTLYRV